MFGKKAHRFIYLTTLVLLAISIPVSVALPNVLGGVLFANWILEWNWKEKWERMKQNRLAMILALFFFCFGYTFIGTTNAAATWYDWLSKTPFFYFPVVVASTAKPELRWQRFFLLAFSIATCVGAALCVIIMQAKGLIDVRQGGLFISHIRFSICAVLSTLFCLHFALQKNGYPLSIQLCCILMSVWLVAYLFYTQVATGILLLSLSFIITFFYYLFKKKEVHGRAIILIVSGLICIALATSFTVVTYQYFHYDKNKEIGLPAFTARHNPYTHLSAQNTDSQIVENGNKLGLYVCEIELREEWGKRSKVPYDSVSKTLIRYLNSMGEHKDAQGMESLEADDIINIEAGIANVDYLQQFGLKKMLYPTYFTFSLYKKYGITSNSSLLQRYELWQAGAQAFLHQPITGYGMACNKAAINQELEKRNSELKPDMGAHSQFLTYALMGGIPLLLCFLCLLFAPFFDKKRKISFLYILFFAVMAISMLYEDTLETTTGINLFLLFNSFFLFCSHPEETQSN
ncbi:MAG: O-antigen ligase family protein [Bacteroidales bacterium]|nr:O-antigen ligase family protein [Bacteroidales bacterium]